MSALIWIHEDALRDDYPVFAAAGSGAEAIFIWDDAYFAAQGYSFKRLVFIYECLLDLPVTLYAGDTATILKELSHGRDIYAAETPNPIFQGVIDTVSATASVHIIPDTAFAHVPPYTDMARFFRYWNKARKSVMTRSE